MFGKFTQMAASVALMLAAGSAFAGDGVIDGSETAAPLASWSIEAAPMDADPSAVLALQYLFIAGSALTPRNSADTVVYDGAGCTHTNAALTTDLQLPEGSTLLGVRVYYYDNAASGSVTLFVTRYDGAGGSDDILMSPLAHATGYSDTYVALATPEVINNLSYSYVLTVNTGTGTRICGLRAFYSTP